MTLQDEVMMLVHEAEKPPGETVPGGATEEDIDALAKRLGIVIPTELREWLLRCNAPPVGPGGIFGICPSDTFLDIEARLRQHPAWLRNGWIPIAGDGVGNHYVLALHSFTGTGHPIFFIDHEADNDVPAYAVASGLWSFLRFLLRADMGTKYWPFDQERVLADDPALGDYSEIPRPWEKL